MGIKGLTKFINKKFRDEDWIIINKSDLSRLIIDGNNICYQLFDRLVKIDQPEPITETIDQVSKRKHCWALGGDYPEFINDVENFFKDIMSRGTTPLVILDGIDLDQSKKETVLQRKISKNVSMKDVQDRKEWDPYELRESVLPLMMLEAFKSVLQSLGVWFCVADGDG